MDKYRVNPLEYGNFSGKAFLSQYLLKGRYSSRAEDSHSAVLGSRRTTSARPCPSPGHPSSESTAWYQGRNAFSGIKFQVHHMAAPAVQCWPHSLASLSSGTSSLGI